MAVAVEGISEVMNHHMTEEEEPQLVEKRRRSRHDNDKAPTAGDDSKVVVSGHNNEVENNDTSEKSVYYDNNEGTTLKLSLSDKNIRLEDVVNSTINNRDIGKLKDEIVQQKRGQDVIGTSGGANTNIRIDLLEESDDEVIELEFERSVEKVHTHTPHCPNCDAQITKVILRRRKMDSNSGKQVDALGCLSCFRFFVPSGECLNRIFGWRAPTAGADSANENIRTPLKQEDDAFGLCGIFRTKPNKKAENLEGNNQVHEQISHIKVDSPLHEPLLPGSGEKHPKLGSPLPSPPLPPSTPPDASGGVANEPKPGPSGSVVLDVTGNEPQWIPASHRSTLLEILKCIVYGGLMESIASLSVVSSAAASDATTLNILAIGLATVFSGLLVFGQHLMDLKNDVSGENADRYEEHLGTRGHFLLHSTFAILAFLVFGLMPPVVYGFVFRESDNKDYKILTVAIAAFVCIFILAIAKAYVQRSQRFREYIKTISYYLTMAIAGSGVGYAVGDLVKILLEKYGLFEPSDPSSASMILGGPGRASYMM